MTNYPKRRYVQKNFDTPVMYNACLRRECDRSGFHRQRSTVPMVRLTGIMHVQTAIFRLFRSRHFRVAMLVFQFVWLNVIVPGHRRGVVALPGGHCAACEEGAARNSQPTCPSDSKSGRHLPGDPAAHCAICFFAARLSPAVAYDFTHPPLRLSGFVPQTAIPIVHCPEFSLTYYGRAPPTSHANVA
jgi:hypothetical protein